MKLWGTYVAGLLMLVNAGVWAQEGSGPQSLALELPPYGVVRWQRQSQPALEVMPLPGDGWLTLARRFAGTSAAARQIKQHNPRLRSPQRGRQIRVPVAVLRDEIKAVVVQRLFPMDCRVGQGWEHYVLAPFGNDEEGWEWLAELFTGDPSHARDLASSQGSTSAAPRRGQRVLIPETMLAPAFARQTPVTRTPTPALARTPEHRPPQGNRSSINSVLAFASDEQGEYAMYRLQKGEALYSAVVVRFTGQLSAVEVNETAAQLARRSGIDDVTAIPVGYPIKIPVELVLPEFLPVDHPRRIQWEAEQRELEQYVEVVRAGELDGVHVILDAGHGGRDTGTIADGLWEATYVYDIMCRIKDNLERHTRATVWTTIKDTGRAFTVVPKDQLPQGRAQILLTHPAFDLNGYKRADRHLPVHLRWYLGNNVVLSRLRQGVARSKIVFISIHADSLHPSVRGAMVYIPSRQLRPESYEVNDSAIRRFREYQENPTVSLTHDFKARAEASSLHLAQQLVSQIQDNGLAVHSYKPIRDRVLRRRKRSWVPAVLRYSLAQNAVLVECCNMANLEDRKLLRDRSWREKFARSLVAGLTAAYASGDR